ncbi:MAG: hypothetical protein FJ304_21990 [Planctomycetes bacterium]|nr:hypothetical protein [Planctomycetota bacterium]
MTTLKLALDRAKKEVARHARGDLPLGFRRDVWRAIGPRRTAKPKSVSKPHLLRLRLAEASVRRVLPIWDAVLSDDSAPHHLLEVANAIIAGDIGNKQAKAAWNENWTYFDDLAYDNEELQPAIMVGYAANQLMLVATQDEQFPAAPDAELVTDQDLEPRDFDPALLASIAAAGGAIWEPETSTKARRAFWNWWIASAHRITQADTPE